MNFETIKEVGDIKGKRIILLVDFNVPHDGIKISDDFRIRKAMPTINFLREKGAKIFLLSHIGSEHNESLKFVADYCSRYFPVIFAKSVEDAKFLNPAEGETVMLDNVRLLSGGEVANDPEFAEKLASLGDIYINEAFSLSHRPHASVVGIPKFLPSYAGFLFAEEVKNLSRAFNPEHPFIFVTGGAKAETKIPLIEKFIHLADKIFVGGVIASAFWKSAGMSVGKSIVTGSEFIKKEWLKNKKIVLPEDVVVRGESGVRKIPAAAVSESDVIVDAGESFISVLKSDLLGAKLVVWNGPVGLCESGFCQATDSLAEAVSSSGAFTIVGGGDTEAEVDTLGLESKFSFVSTGGGAMLEFLAKETLPGIQALEEQV